MRRLLSRIVAASVALSALFFVSAPASAETTVSSTAADLDCVITITTDVSPGVTPQPSLNTFTSNGYTGVAYCTGTVTRKPVTGPGAFSIYAIETATCTSLEGQGWFSIRVPTTGGMMTVNGTYTSGFSGDMTGTAEVIAILAGDCYNTPITRLTTRLYAHIGPVDRR